MIRLPVLIIFFFVVSIGGHAQVNITPAIHEVCGNNVVLLNNIVIQETTTTDFVIPEEPEPGQALVFTATSGTFGGTPIVTFSSSGITPVVQISGSQITVSMNAPDASDESVLNALTIEGLEYYPDGGAGAFEIRYSAIDLIVNGLDLDETVSTINVKDNPDPIITGNASVCQGTNQTYSTESGKTNYTWDLNGGTIVSGGSSTNHTITIVWSSFEGNVRVTYTQGNGCGSSQTLNSVTAYSVPVGVPTTQDVCTGVTLKFGLFTTIGNGVSSDFEFLAADNPNVTGERTTLTSGSQIGDALTLSGTTPQNVVYTVTPTSQQGSCVGESYEVTLTVNPSPDLSIVNNTPVIASGATTDIEFSSTLAGATFSYSVSAAAAIIGAGEGSKSPINQILTNTGGIAQPVTYYITSSFGSCQANDLVTVNVNGFPTIATADSLALVALYNATGGINWPQQSNWLFDAANTWYGVGVTDNRVTSLSLPSNNLEGALPAGFYALDQLTSLDLHNNRISGHLSASIANFTNLQTLNLHINELSGPIPAGLYTLTSLAVLQLNSNRFTGAISSSIGDLTNLQVARFDDLPLSGTIPSEIFSLTSLQDLGISGQLNGPLPSTISGIAGLTHFTCDSCAITALPAEISTISGLTTLNIRNNALSSLPDLSSLPSLTVLDISKNQLSFESIEPYLGLETFTYAPQDSLDARIAITLQTDTEYTMTIAAGGSDNHYQWKKNNINVGTDADSFTIPAAQFSDEGVYTVDVTSAVVPDLTLHRYPVRIKVSSLKRDSLSLVEVFTRTNGPGWTNKTGWLAGNLATWHGVTVTSNRVSAVNLSNNNLTGAVPAEISDILNLTNLNLASNRITAIPDLTPLTLLTAANVSNNKLDFASLEPNVSILNKINYTNQADIGTPKEDLVASGATVKLKTMVGGENNIYQWRKNDAPVASATDSTYIIGAIGRATMGRYTCDITNTLITGLTLKSAPHIVLAVADLSGTLWIDPGVPALKGKVTLLRVTPEGGYDTLRMQNIATNGQYAFDDVILDDYQLLGFADTVAHAGALPTYYKKTILWEEADILVVNNSLNDLDIVSEKKPGPSSGKGIISGFVEEDDGTGSGRTKKPKRVSDAGVSARRVENTGRGKEEVLTLVAYVFTNENGEFTIRDLPKGEYRLNIQYPGYPMDETSFVTIPIGDAFQAEVRVEATVDGGKIVVRQLIVTGLWEREHYTANAYPNPSSEFIRLEFPSASPTRTTRLYDAMGREMIRSNAPNREIIVDIRALPKGNYLLHIDDNGSLAKTLHVVIE